MTGDILLFAAIVASVSAVAMNSAVEVYRIRSANKRARELADAFKHSTEESRAKLDAAVRVLTTALDNHGKPGAWPSTTKKTEDKAN